MRYPIIDFDKNGRPIYRSYWAMWIRMHVTHRRQYKRLAHAIADYKWEDNDQ